MEYTFFSNTLRARFISHAAEMGVETQVRDDAMEGSVVALSDDLDDEQMDNLEQVYDTLMDEQMLLAESEEGWVTHKVMGVNISRADGSTQAVRLQGEVARRLVEYFTPVEIHDLVQEIAQNIEQPVFGPICKK
ncbi:MAG: hypothetical protein ACOH1I_06010 [Gallionellaceae bacterium]|jgi:hypothetical protein